MVAKLPLMPPGRQCKILALLLEVFERVKPARLEDAREVR